MMITNLNQHTQDTVIVSFARTPIGKLSGGLAGVTAPQLGATAIKEALTRACKFILIYSPTLWGCA